MAKFNFEPAGPSHDSSEYDFDPVDPPEAIDAPIPYVEPPAPRGPFRAPKPKTQAQNVDEVLEDFEEEQQEETELSEVESRLELASYYRLLLNDNLFDDGSDTALQVEKEIRDFVRSRLEVLLGMRSSDSKDVILKSSPPPPPQFDPQETQALKALAAKVLGKPALIEAKTAPKPKAPPMMKKVAVAEALPPRQAPVVVKPPPQRSPGVISKQRGRKIQPQRPQNPVAPPSPVAKKVQQVMVTAEGKEYVADFTGQVKPGPGSAQPIPMPTGINMTAVTAAQADATVAAQKFDEATGSAVSVALTRK